MRHREAFDPKPVAVKDTKALTVLADQVEKIASKKDTPAIHLIEHDLVDAFLQGLNDIHNRPKEIAIEMIYAPNGKIVAMVGTTDPEKIAIIRKSGDSLGYVDLKTAAGK